MLPNDTRQVHEGVPSLLQSCVPQAGAQFHKIRGWLPELGDFSAFWSRCEEAEMGATLCKHCMLLIMLGKLLISVSIFKECNNYNTVMHILHFDYFS